MADASLSAGKTPSGWKAKQAYAMAIVCLLVGVMAGYLLRGSSSPAVATSEDATAPVAAQPASMPAGPSTGSHPMPTMEQMKQMADKMAAPLLEKLKANPNDTNLLIQVGNIYEKTHQFKPAAEYYEKALKSQPGNADVRTDMATAYWYTGNADAAIAEFNKALAYQPNKAIQNSWLSNGW